MKGNLRLAHKWLNPKVTVVTTGFVFSAAMRTTQASRELGMASPLSDTPRLEDLLIYCI